ncbi:MAG TPA: hypothetical protein VFO16_18515 [Pseudonocardiaceae bacterium]|nr:hypothetical protein [Pseudonocardiaceae bacterium]
MAEIGIDISAEVPKKLTTDAVEASDVVISTTMRRQHRQPSTLPMSSARGYTLLAARAHLAYAQAIQQSDPTASGHALRTAASTFSECGATLRHQQSRSPLPQPQSVTQRLNSHQEWSPLKGQIAHP